MTMHRVFFATTTASPEFKAVTVGGAAEAFAAHDEPVNGITLSHDVRD